MASLARTCREAHGDLLSFVGTLEAALDLERLWFDAGEPQISILGSSYGSQVAALYASEPIDAAGAGSILVLAATGDPTTPITAARRSLTDLEEAALLVLDAERHLTYPCAVLDPDRPAHVAFGTRWRRSSSTDGHRQTGRGAMFGTTWNRDLRPTCIVCR